MKEFWDYRYAHENYAYGEMPNRYFQSKIDTLAPAKLLLPGEGEGRNAVYATLKGWDVTAFDYSESGRFKAMNLAQKNNVSFDYQVCDAGDAQFADETFDAIALVHVHFTDTLREKYHRKLNRFLKKGGYIIVEAFHKDNLKMGDKRSNANGPKELDKLYLMADFKTDFPDFEILEHVHEIVELNEGQFHQGCSSMIRFFARKNK